MIVGLGLGVAASSHFIVTAAGEVIRKKIGVTAVGDAQVDTAQSQFGGASALFDGTGDCLDCNEPLLPALTDWTMEGWFYPTSIGELDYLFSQFTGAPAGRMSSYMTATGEIALFINGLDGPNIGTTQISVNNWYHIAFVRNGDNFYGFLNGNQEFLRNDASVSVAQSPTFVIGAQTNTGTAGFIGNIDEVRISNIARYTAGFTPSTTPFVNDENTLLLLHMDGTDASTVFEDDNGVRSKKGITANGNAQIDTAQSKFGGSSYYGDGSSNYLIADIPNKSSITDFTFECWLRIESTANGAVVLFQGYPLTSQRQFYVVLTGPEANRIYLSSNQGYKFVSWTPSLNTWYHIALTVSSTGDAKIYIDGTQLGSTITGVTMSSVIGTDNQIAFGRYQQSNLSSLYGWMDEIRLSNSVRYTGNFTPSTTPFVNDENTLLLLHMDGTDASTFFEDDNGVRSKKGITAIGNAQVDTAQSKFGGASAVFDGADDYLRTFYNTNFTGDFTIECWARFSSIATDQTVWQFGDSNNDALQIYLYTTAGSDQYKMRLDVWGRIGAFSSVTVTTNTWYHFATVRSGSTVTLYIDGTSRATLTRSQTIGNGGDFYIAARQGATFDFNGHIDEMRISNTARYTANFTPATTPFQNDSNTVLLLHFDGTDGSTVFTDDNGVPPDYDYGA